MKGTHNPRIQARKCVASNAEYPTHIAVGRDSDPLPHCVSIGGNNPITRFSLDLPVLLAQLVQPKWVPEN